MLDHKIWFKDQFSEVRSMYVHRWGINGPKLQHTLCLEYDDNFLMNELPVNRCIEAVTGGRPGLRWCGNVLALRMGSSYDFFESVDMEEDLKSLARFLEEYAE
jgi:hypothetical protein